MEYIKMFDESIMNNCSKPSRAKYGRIRDFIKTEERARRLDKMKVRNWYIEIFADHSWWKIAFISKKIEWEEKIKYFEFLLVNKVDIKHRGEKFLWECKEYEYYEVTSRICKFRRNILSKEEKKEYEELRLKAKAKYEKENEDFRKKHGDLFGNFFNFRNDKNYEVLGIKKGNTKDEIKKAYRKLCKIHHPDVGGDITKFREINEAYKILTR